MPSSENGGSTAGVGSMTLDDFVSDAFGDVSGSESVTADPGESPGAMAGDPPAASSDPSTDTPEGAAAAEHAGDPPAVAAPNTPDPATPAAPTAANDVDPLASATPLTYRVNGQDRTFEEIRLLGEHGGIIPPEHLAKVQQRLSERDHLFEQNQQRQSAYQSLERLTAWNVTDPQTKAVTTLTGSAAMAERQAVAARSLAVNDVLVKALQDPATFASLVTTSTDAQGNPIIVIDEMARNALFTRAELAAVRAEQVARAHITRIAAPPTPSAPAEPDLAAIAPSTVDLQLREHKLTVPPESRDFLISQLPRYVRATTAEERAADPQLGARILDRAFLTLMQREATAHAQQKAVADRANAANRSNTAVLSAAAVGARGKPPAQRPVAAPTTPDADPQAEAWRARERALAASL